MSRALLQVLHAVDTGALQPSECMHALPSSVAIETCAANLMPPVGCMPASVATPNDVVAQTHRLVCSCAPGLRHVCVAGVHPHLPLQPGCSRAGTRVPAGWQHPGAGERICGDMGSTLPSIPFAFCPASAHLQWCACSAVACLPSQQLSLRRLAASGPDAAASDEISLRQ